MYPLRHLPFIILFALCFLYAPDAYVQFATTLKQGDTLSYTLKSRKKTWLEVTAPEANMVIGYYGPEGKWTVQDQSPAVGSVERIHFDPEKIRDHSIKIWPAAYLETVQDVHLLVREQAKPGVLKTTFQQKEWLEDLATFKRIRTKANSGLLVYRTQKEIDSAFNRAEQAIKTDCKDLFDFYKIIVSLTDFEGSCHNVTYLPEAIDDYFKGQSIYFPIAIKYLKGTLINNSPHQQIPLGAEILSVNDVPAAELITRLAKYYPTDGFSRPYKERLAVEKGLKEKYLIEFGTSAQYRVKYKWEGGEKVLSLPGLDAAAFKQMQEKRHSSGLDSLLLKEKYSFVKLKEDLYQLSIRGFDFAQSEQDSAYHGYEAFLDSAFALLNRKPGNQLVLDLRYNSGGAGFLYTKTFSYMSERPFRDAQFAYSSFNEVPEKEALVLSSFLLANAVKNSSDIEVHLKQRFPVGVNGRYYLSDTFNPLVLPHKEPFKGPVILLVDEQVASAGAHLASLVKSYTNCITIGRETCGGYYEHNGHLPFLYQLPHTKIQTGFSIVYVNQDARLLESQPKGRGIVPDIELEATVGQFLKQEDATIRYILNNY